MVACVLVIAAGEVSTSPRQDVPAGLLDRIGRYVEDYYNRTRTIVGRETVRLQPLDGSLRPDGVTRFLEFELRIEWGNTGEALAAPTMTRRLTRSMGRLENSSRTPDCFDPQASSIEPMAVVLRANQEQFNFSLAGMRDDGRVAIVDYSPGERKPPSVEWNGLCASIELNGQIDGRIWAEVETGTVLRIEERLRRPYQFVVPALVGTRAPVSQTIDRLETMIRYEAVKFRDPDETLMLPKSMRTLAVIYNGGVPRLLTLQSFDQYRRFMTAGRIVK
jgi:hypothetical protein